MPHKQADPVTVQSVAARLPETGGRGGCLVWDEAFPVRRDAGRCDQAVIAFKVSAWLSTQTSNA